MPSFEPKSATFSGSLTVDAPVDEAFPLFSPLGEKDWVPGWDPELLHPPGSSWKEGLVFRTREEYGDAVWVVTRLDGSRHEVRYHRVEPDRYVARVEVRCSAAGDRATSVAVTYEYVGLSARGNDEIAAMTQDDYDRKMERWSDWIRERRRASA